MEWQREVMTVMMLQIEASMATLFIPYQELEQLYSLFLLIQVMPLVMKDHT